jgi:hypothetical protein
MNFGRIKDIYANYLIESYSNGDNKGKKLYKKFLKTLNEDEILKTQFIVYKNLESTNELDKNEAHDYLRENVNLFNNFNKSDIKESNKRLVDMLISEGFSVEIDLPHKELHENINKLITLEKKATTLNKLQESFGKVKEFLVENKETITLDGEEYVKENVDPSKFLSIATEKYNEKYNEQLSEEEKSIVKVIREGSEEEKKALLEKYVKETITLVNEELESRKDNMTLKETLLNVKEMVYNTIESDDLKEGILKLYDLKKDLSE